MKLISWNPSIDLFSATDEVPFSYLSTNSYYFIKIVPFCFPFQFKVLFLRYLAIQSKYPHYTQYINKCQIIAIFWSVTGGTCAECNTVLIKISLIWIIISLELYPRSIFFYVILCIIYLVEYITPGSALCTLL